VRIVLASALLGGVSYVVWWALDDLLGRDVLAQVISLGVALVAGAGTYIAVVLAMGIPEARQILDLLARRFGRSAS
jgi:putative peptidoglycan lipid II flippase